ncbi:MAG: response regulator transcription factor [Sphingomonadales bacterium]|nr:response regulator transcription factor [Sphingomonadales bacterium]
MSKISVLLVDDHKLIRESWNLLLSSDDRFEIVGETSDVEQATAVAASRKPQVVLMDINMTPVNGFEATKQVLKQSPHSQVIGVSMHSMPAYARRMFQVGARGYVTKNSSKDELFQAIEEVVAGNKYICEEIKNILAHQELDEDSEYPDMNSLSKREIEVVSQIRQGFSSKEIAQRLEISFKTVEVHRYNILKKLKLKNTAALVNFINAQGL